MYKLFKRFLNDYKKQVILGPAFKLIEAVFELIIPIIVAMIIDTGIGNRDKGYVIKMSFVMILLGVIGLCSTLVCQYFASKASQGFGTDLRNTLFSHINGFSFSQLEKISSAGLVNRIINDTEQLQTAVAMLIRLVIRAPFIVVGSTVMAMVIDFKMSLIFIAAGIIIALFLYVIISKTSVMYLDAQRYLDKTTLITRENLTGVRVVRAFSKQKYESRRFKETSNVFTDISIKIGRISALLNPITFLVVNLAVILILWSGGRLVNTGELTTGEIIAFINYMTLIQTALVVVANLVVIFTKASASAKRVNEILDISPESVINDDNQNTYVSDDVAVKVSNVKFSYGNADDLTLDDISFEIKKGETVAIVGGTASGKTTLVNIMAGFYNCNEGTVIINGENINNIPKDILRRTISVAQQNSVIFSGTIKDNLSMGSKNVTEYQLENVLKIAQATDFVKQKGGLSSLINQGGKNLSGGQKQRLSIARALAAEPDILILDDSMSALDAATGSSLIRALKKETEKMTLIIVSQRISSLISSDKIIVLDDGKISGIGKHEELLKKCEKYREIYYSQSESGQVEN